MYQYDDPTAVQTRPAPTVEGIVGWFSDGNPSTGQVATILRAEFMNMLMAELLSILTAAGISPSKGDSNQLLLALRDAGVFETPPQFDQSTKVATMAALARMGMQSSAFALFSANATLTAAHVGGTVQVIGNAAPVSLTLPLASVVFPAIGRVEVINSSSYAVTILRQGSDVLAPINGVPGTSVVIMPGDSATIECENDSTWVAVGGTSQLPFSANFGSNLVGAGYQKLPSGLIIQWGNTSVSVAANTATAISITYPIAFPATCLWAVAIPKNAVGSSRTAESWNTSGASGFAIHNTAVTLLTQWIAIGY